MTFAQRDRSLLFFSHNFSRIAAIDAAEEEVVFVGRRWKTVIVR